MNREKLLNLAERCEKATGPDRELDADLDVALFGGVTVWKQANYTMESYPASRRESKHHVGGFVNNHVPLYTASLDAAIALVERMKPGWGFYLRSDKEGHGCGLVYPDAFRVTPCHCMGATPAIAVCLALFRALESSDDR